MPKRKRDQDGLFERSDSPYYWVSFTDAGGQRVRRSTGIRKSTEGKKEAEALLAKWKLEAHQERQWNREPSRSFEEVMVEYMGYASKLKSAESIRLFVKQLRVSFAGRAMEGLRGVDIEAHKARRRADGMAYGSINRELEVLSAAINYCRTMLEWNLPNPVIGRMFKEPEGRVRWINHEEAGHLLDAARTSRSPYLADLLTLALNTGMRREEMLGLEWKRVDLQARLIHLEAHHTKAGKRRSVPMNEAAYAAILSRARYRAVHCPASPWVFCKQHGERLHEATKGFLAACVKVGIVDFRFHDLRHTCAAWLVSAGVPLSEVRDLLGHSTVTMTERYAHLAPERVRNAVAVLDEVHMVSRFSHTQLKTASG
jgi:integrase